jgi:hypothetical protein
MFIVQGYVSGVKWTARCCVMDVQTATSPTASSWGRELIIGNHVMGGGGWVQYQLQENRLTDRSTVEG